jgi:hypothetical protein
MMSPQLGDDAKRVLRAVAERDMDGYTLARQTKLDQAQLEAAVRELTSNELLRVKGEATGDRLLEAWFQAAPGAMRFLGSSAY